MVEDYFGDGGRCGIKIEYVTMWPENLTTDSNLQAKIVSDPIFLMMYCDNYWPMSPTGSGQRFRRRRAAMVTVYGIQTATRVTVSARRRRICRTTTGAAPARH